MKTTRIIAFFILITATAQAQDIITPAQYVDRYKEIAITEMKRTGVPAAITLAQGLLETENGNGALVKKSNNHFGIKCKTGWTAASVNHDDDEKGECFRQYNTPEESYKDHSDFLRNGQRYSFLFNLDVTDYKGWAYGLKKAGYATNPAYSRMLINNIEKYNLQQYTLQAMGEIPVVNAATVVENANPATTTGDIAPMVNYKQLFINGSKCVLVNQGTSLLAVATQNNISLAKLLAFNDLTDDGLLAKEQYIFIEKKSKTGNNVSYITEAGESLYDVAQKNGIQLKALLEYNQLVGSEHIDAGTQLYLQQVVVGSKQPIGSKVVSAIAAKTVIHVVQSKESLYGIAKKYNTTMRKLREWNKLQSDALSIGQQLIVSQ